jgi:hypothetical protein
VLADVGATRPRYDAVDRRILDDVRKRGHTFVGSKGKLPGIIDSPKDVGGWPEYTSSEPPADTDCDGIPDAWEVKHGLDPKDPADGAAFRPDGYTNLEHYLNELARPTQRPSADPKYLDTIQKRAREAVAAAKLDDAAKRATAVAVVSAHSVGINDIHFDRDDAVKAANGDKEKVAAARQEAAAAVAVVHGTFTKDLSAILTPEQCEAVKDKMTYDVRLLTFQVYCDMLPKLTEAEKATIRAHLLAGREEALVAGDANEKHEKFRMAKGKIVHYLSKQGHDLKKAEAEWDEKRKKPV